MIVRCPACSTDFNLPSSPAEHSTARLRCSKCDHLFDVRFTDANAEILNSLDPSLENSDALVDEKVGNSTWMGMPQGIEETAEMDAFNAESIPPASQDQAPTADTVQPDSASPLSMPSAPSHSSYNPFPHAGDAPIPAPAAGFASPSLPDPTAVTPDRDSTGTDRPTQPPSADEDPFAGAFDEPDQAPPAQTSTAPQPTPAPEQPISPDSPAVDAFASEPLDAPGADDDEDAFDNYGNVDFDASPDSDSDDDLDLATRQTFAHAPPGLSVDADDVDDDDPDAFWKQQNVDSRFGSADELVDPSFGEDGEYFDPEKGRVQVKPAAQAPAPSTKPAPPREQSAPSANRASAPRPTEKAPSPAAKPTWDVNSPIEAHTVGGSGIQKFANLLLITLLVLSGFLGLVAALNDGLFDFKRIPHMLEVAFDGADFEPRPSWIPDPEPPQLAPVENPLRLEGVVAHVIEGEDSPRLAIRGRIRNTSSNAYAPLQVRALLKDANDKVVTQQTAAAGSRLTLAQLREAPDPERLRAMESADALPLAPKSSQPFTLVFFSLPDRARADLHYTVEIADSQPISPGSE